MKLLKNKKFQLRETETYIKTIHTFANAVNKDAAEFVREAINEKMEKVARRKPELQKELPRAA